MSDGRKRISHAIAALGTALLAGSVLTIAPSYADPDIDDVQARVDRLYHEAEQASERFNVVRANLQTTRARLIALRADLTRQRDKVELVRDQVAGLVLAESQGQSLTSTSRLLLAEDPDEFLAQLATVSAHNDQQAQMMADFVARAERLDRRESAVAVEMRRIATAKDRLAAEQAAIDEKAGAAKELLAELKEQQRARLEAARQARQEAAQTASRSADRAPAPQDTSGPPAPPAGVSASGGAAAAVGYALGQVGDAYGYGATGESAFDCSGLTMRAWAQAGVTLPHSSSMQMSAGTPVSVSSLQPGDLVFYYSPVSHVGIYVGNGQLVHAANPSTGVSTTSVDSMPIAGAVRPG